jgi:hypothetical protein
MFARTSFATLLLAVLTLPAEAAPLLRVEGVVSPAWVEHADGRREPVAVGADVQEGERIATGPDARVLLRMGEGSTVKLGEQAMFAVPQRGNEMRGAGALRQDSLDVPRGAFRYTMGRLTGPTAERDLTLRFGTIVAGIRGTDVWGKSDAAKDRVLLIDGRITVTHAGRQLTLDQPRTVLVAPRDGSTPPPARISTSELAAFAAETEIFAGAGGAVTGGRYRVVVITTVDETYARDLHARLRTAGYPAELRAIDDEGSPLFQTYIAQLSGEREARAVAQRLRALGYTEARPTR